MPLFHVPSVPLAPCLWMARPWRCWGRRRPSTVTWEGSDLESQCTFCLKGFFSSCTIWHREQTGVREHTESRVLDLEQPQILLQLCDLG